MMGKTQIKCDNCKRVLIVTFHPGVKKVKSVKTCPHCDYSGGLWVRKTWDVGDIRKGREG